MLLKLFFFSCNTIFSDTPLKTLKRERKEPNSAAEAKDLVESLAQNAVLPSVSLFEHVDFSLIKRLSLALCDNTMLQYLSIFDVCSKGASMLARALRVNRTLRALVLISRNDLRYPDMGAAGVCAIADALQHNTTLRLLQISGHTIESVPCKALYQSIQINASLHTLELGNCALNDSGAALIAGLISADMPALKKLVLRRNLFTVIGGEDLASALAVNHHLENFQLFDLNLGDATLKKLAESLSANKSLRILKFYSMYDCTADGMAALINAVASSTTLRVVSVSATMLAHDSESASKITVPWARAVYSNTTLEKLDVEECLLSAKDCLDLLQAVKSNTNLVKLKLQGNLADASCVTAIEALIEAHPTLQTLTVSNGILPFDELAQYLGKTQRTLELA